MYEPFVGEVFIGRVLIVVIIIHICLTHTQVNNEEAGGGGGGTDVINLGLLSSQHQGLGLSSAIQHFIKTALETAVVYPKWVRWWWPPSIFSYTPMYINTPYMGIYTLQYSLFDPLSPLFL